MNDEIGLFPLPDFGDEPPPKESRHVAPAAAPPGQPPRKPSKVVKQEEIPHQPPFKAHEYLRLLADRAGFQDCAVDAKNETGRPLWKRRFSWTDNEPSSSPAGAIIALFGADHGIRLGYLATWEQLRNWLGGSRPNRTGAGGTRTWQVVASKIRLAQCREITEELRAVSLYDR